MEQVLSSGDDDGPWGPPFPQPGKPPGAADVRG